MDQNWSVQDLAIWSDPTTENFWEIWDQTDQDEHRDQHQDLDHKTLGPVTLGSD